jgi:hypothetical protein
MPGGIADLFQGTAFNVLMVVLTLGALGLAALAAWYARRELRPRKRQLTISMFPPAPLLSSASSSVPNIEVLVDRTEVSDPHLAVLSIINSGHHDISDQHFYDQRPLRIDFHVPIVGLLEASVSPLYGETIPHEVDGSILKVGPGLIPHGQQVLLPILFDGKPTQETLDESVRYDLLDAEVHVKKLGHLPGMAMSFRKVMSIVLFGAIAVLAIVLINVVNIGSPRISLSSDHGVAGGQITILGENFERFAVIKAEIFDEIIGHTQADENGEFEMAVTVPNHEPGYLEIQVWGTGSGTTYYRYADFAIVDSS